MKTFTYTIKDAEGIHARPAGLLVKEAKKYQSKIQMTKNNVSVDLTRLMAIMGLGVKCGDTVEIVIEGVDEDVAWEEMQTFFSQNL